MTRDWRKVFTEAFRGSNVKRELDKLFDEGKLNLSREEFEEITVKTSSIVMEEVERQRGSII